MIMAEYLYEGATFISGDNYVVIQHDDDPMSPREFENMGVFVTWMNNYNSPDKEMTPEEIIIDLGLLDEWEASVDDDYDLDDDELQLKFLLDKAAKKEIYLLPVSGYSHSGLTLSVGYPNQFIDWQWDAGFAGVIYTTDDRIKWYGTPKDKVLDALREEVEDYNTWLQGECWGYITYDRAGEEGDSCWGFIGETTDCMAHHFENELTSTDMNLYEWVESNKHQPDMIVRRYNNLVDRYEIIMKEFGDVLDEITDRDIHVRVDANGRMNLDAA